MAKYTKKELEGLYSELKAVDYNDLEIGIDTTSAMALFEKGAFKPSQATRPLIILSPQEMIDSLKGIIKRGEGCGTGLIEMSHKFVTTFYNILFEIPDRDLPLYINEKIPFSIIVAWRMRQVR